MRVATFAMAACFVNSSIAGRSASARSVHETSGRLMISIRATRRSVCRVRGPGRSHLDPA